jgi:hypothetical protein
MTFGVLQFLSRETVRSQFDESAQKLVADLLKSGALPYYVNSCLDKSVKEGIVLAGQQGGNIYKHQGGPLAVPAKFLPMTGTLNGQPISTQLAYGVVRPTLVNGTVYPDVPGYPGGRNYSNQVPRLVWGNFGRFGEVSLQRLCDVDGANRPFVTPVVLTQLAFTPICQQNMYSDVDSTQWQIEEFVKGRLEGCVNWSLVREETGYNVTSLGSPNVTLRLGDVDVWVDAVFPIQVKVGGREPVKTVAEFHVREPIRLKRVVELAASVAMYDAYKLNWNISSGVPLLYPFDSFMSFSVYKYPLDGVWSDIVEIHDSGSQIDGQDFVYRFARENRLPALDYIHYTPNETFDIVTIENNVIWIMPNPDPNPAAKGAKVIYDPDEDNLTYDYTGWKETCDEPFNFGTGLNEYVCSHKVVSPFDPDPSVTPKVGREPKNWTESEPYLLSNRNATFTTNHSDIGPHNVTVWVCDEERLCDYQIVRIMVYDIPELHLNFSNDYDDINFSAASVEDHFRFDASGTTTYFSPMITFVFKDLQEPFELFTTYPLTVLELPDVPTNISNIDDFLFKKSALNGQKSVEHQIEFTTAPALPNPIIRDVTVYQCLPHRNPADPFPWPYNKSDAFQADHTCCSNGTDVSGQVVLPQGWGEYLPDTTRCFSRPAQLGMYDSFVDEPSFEGIGNTFVMLEDGFVPTPHSLSVFGNDIFIRKFERFCSGDRGNICSGDAYDSRFVFQSCSPDRDFDAGDTEFCSGPTSNFKVAVNLVKPFYLPSLPEFIPPFCGNGEVDPLVWGIQEECDIGLDGVASTSDDVADNCDGGNKLLCADNCLCYVAPQASCKTYTYSPNSNKNTFEEEYGLPRSDGTPATGVCNDGPRCTTKDDYTLPGNYLSQGVCKGADGCKGVRVLEDCDAQVSDCQVASGDVDNKFFVYTTKCDDVVKDCVAVADPALKKLVDDLPVACSKCAAQGKTADGFDTQEPSTSCCGDDKGEGGYPYKHFFRFNVYSYTPTGAAFGITGTNSKTEKYCDDYWGDNSNSQPGNNYRWIDNDCDGLKNCLDPDCYSGSNPSTGPLGGRCCTTTPSDSCVSSSFLPGSSCNGFKECDCIASGTSFAAPDKTLSALGQYNGCVANTNEAPSNQKILKFTNIGGTNRNFNVVFTPSISGGNCAGNTIRIFGPAPTYTPLSNTGTSFSSLQVDPEFYVAFRSAAPNDCKYSLTIT